MKLEHFKSTTVVPNSSLKEPESIYQYYMGQEGGGLFYETFEEQMNVKYMNVYSLSVILFFRKLVETSTESNWSWNKTTNVSTA